MAPFACRCSCHIFCPEDKVSQWPALSIFRSVSIKVETANGAPWLTCQASTTFISSTLKFIGMSTTGSWLFNVFCSLKLAGIPPSLI